MSATAHPDPRRHKLRGLIASLEVELAALSGDHDKATKACEELVAAMDLGPEPATRTCPGCGALGMADALRCGHCWMSLPATH